MSIFVNPDPAHNIYVKYSNSHTGKLQIQRFGSKEEAGMFAQMVNGQITTQPFQHGRHNIF